MGQIPKIDTYYTCKETLEKRLRVKGRKDAFCSETKEAYEAWKTELRGTLSNLLGLQNMMPCPLEWVQEERVEIEDGIIREKVIIKVEEDVWMPVFVLIPPKVKDVEVPCIMALPGHMGAGKYSVAGCREYPAVAQAIERFNYDYGLQLAKLGYVAFCPDCRGFGERREEALQADTEQALMGCTCFHLAHMAEPLGLTVAGMCAWDAMRLIDYIQARGQWKCEKVGCIGFSGGGMQTLWASAMDDRIAISVISGYLYGYQDSLLTLNGNCSCNYVPGLWMHADMGDIAALLAPHPLMVQSCQEDHLNGPRGLQNVYEQLETVKKAYALFGTEEQLVHDIRPGGHCWHGEPLGAFLEQAQDWVAEKSAAACSD